MASNDDAAHKWEVEPGVFAVGVGNFHKTLPHNEYGEVCPAAFGKLIGATRGNGGDFGSVPPGDERFPGDGTFKFTNPQAGLAADRLTHHPTSYSMPPAPPVRSPTTAAEMTELYWMALHRDAPLNQLESYTEEAAHEVDEKFKVVSGDTPDLLRPGIDIPGSPGSPDPITPHNLFRLGLPGEEYGPMLSQFFVRPIPYGTQAIDQRERPYKEGQDYLTNFPDWLSAQNSGKDRNGLAYNEANEHDNEQYGSGLRYISTMRDLARFVNKDALHQAYFNATLILLSGGAKWTSGNPYKDGGKFAGREVGFGVLGGPHILALVSEVATRALKVIWNQKWQVHLRLRPEAYGGLVHVQKDGNGQRKRDYGLPQWIAETAAARAVRSGYGTYLLPMAFTPGSPTHPAYGAGHATVAGACVTVLKAYFKLLDEDGDPIRFNTLGERVEPSGELRPYGKKTEIKSYATGMINNRWDRFELPKEVADALTIEGELNKLAQNVAMGRSMGGVHWRTDNTRSLILGEALAAEILADITTDVNERPSFTFRTFARGANGKPKTVLIENGRILVDGMLVDTHGSAL